ncbi:MAG: DUF488 domain-containing protein [Methylobacter sp.]|uniref:DUF488 domain-containing protein n=1 Tax=Methylobacter sp. TaxID=2051955 RepID=UPI00259125D9|nr:DUF488 domain-containing protein [Methylobacter sp.]MCL7420858.1 DUF488 domain-containing protein [Methylobacter sp.]
MKRIFTIGYEGASLDDFIATLKLLRVEKLIDVREFATSRRKGFSKTALQKALENSNVKYQHERSLGSPKDIRHRLRQDNDYTRYFSEFRNYLETQDLLLKTLANDSSESIVLMCYERDSRICHRSVVAEKIGVLSGIRPVHLGVQKHDVRKAHQGKIMDFSQSLSAT